MTSTSPLPTLFIPHGGGPCFFMDDPDGLWTKMAAYLRSIAASLDRRPKAILVISAHWEEAVPTVQTTARPALMFDYYGFPKHTYALTYPAPGAPSVAARVRALLGQAGIASAEDGARAFDHGVFVPFLLINPDADIPIVQLSLRHDLDPAFHLRMGQALSPLRDEGVLIVGSGMSFHNLRAFWGDPTRPSEAAKAFDDWLTETVTTSDPAHRTEGLSHWPQAPGAQYCHPREEHLLPLMVVAGAAGTDPATRVYGETLLGNAQSGYRFG